MIQGTGRAHANLGTSQSDDDARPGDGGATSYIDRNLLDGERVVFRTRVTWLIYFWPVFFIVVLVPVAWLAASGSGKDYATIALAVAALILLAAVIKLIAAIIKRHSSDFVVTNKRVMMKVGVFDTRSIELLLGKIEAIAVEQTLLGRILDYGDIVITGSGGTREPFAHIQAPLAFRRAVQSVTDAPLMPAPGAAARSPGGQ